MKKGSLPILVVILLTCLSCTSTMTKKTPGQITPEIFYSPPPPKAMEMFQKAKNLERKKPFEAINTYRQIAAEFENNVIAPKALMRVADLLAKLGRWEDVLAYCSYILSKYPIWKEKPKVSMLATKANLFLKNFQRVIQAKSEIPETSYKELYLGLAYCGVGNFEKASEHLEKFMDKSLKESSFSYNEAVEISADILTPNQLQNLTQKKLSKDLRSFLHCVTALKEIKKSQKGEARKRLEFLKRSLDPAHPLQPTVDELLLRLQKHEIAEEVDIHALGLIIPLDGRYGKYGRKIIRGVSLAVSEWNNRNSQDYIKLIVENTSADPSLVLKAYKDMLHKHKVFALLGPLGKSRLNALLSQQELNSLLVVAFCADIPRTDDIPFHLRVMPKTSDVVKAITLYAIKEKGFKNLAILYPEDLYGEKAKKDFESISSKLGGTILSSVGYPPGITDFKTTIKKLFPEASAKESNITVPFDAIFIPDEIGTVTLIAPQLLYYNIVGVSLLGTNLWENPRLGVMSNGYMDGSYYATPYFLWSEDKETIKFRSQFYGLYNTWPGYLEAQGYDAARLLLAIRKTLMPKSITRNDIIEAAKGFNFKNSITGISQISWDGSIERTYKIIGIHGSKPIQVYP